MPQDKDNNILSAKKRKQYKTEAKKRNYSPRANSKDAILEAAMRVFSWYGFEETTMEMIANEAAVSRALVIKYFHNLDTVAKLAIQHFMERFHAQIQHSAYRAGITYWDHTENIFEMLKINRAQWRFVLSYLLPQSRAGIEQEIPPAQLKDITDHVPDTCRPKNVPMIEHFMASIYLAYVIGGNEQKYHEAKEIVFQCLSLK